MMTGTGTTTALAVAFLVYGTHAARLDTQTFFVDCEQGSDAGGTPGTQSAPFRSPMRARDALRAARSSLPNTGAIAGEAPVATVYVAGLCELNTSLTLGAQDSSTTWRAWPGGAAAILSGGTSIPMPPHGSNGSAPVVVDLATLGFDRASLGVLKARGYAGGSACIRLDAFEPSAAELSYRRHDAVAGRADVTPADVQMDIARFPNRAPGAHASTSNWESVGTLANKSSFALSTNAKARAARWASEIGTGSYPLFTHGLWTWNWADSHRTILGADAEAGVLNLGDDDQADRDAPLKPGGHYFVYNALSELDAAGEYHIDPSSLTLRFLPPPAATPAPNPGATCAWSVEVSRSDEPGAVWEVLNVTGPPDDRFAFVGECSASWGPMGAHCAASLGVKAGANLMTNSAGVTVGEGVCCNGVTDAVVKATRGSCTGGAPTPAPSVAGDTGSYHLSRLASVVTLDSASDIVFEGLEIRHARGAAVVVRDCTRAALHGCTVADSGMMGVNVTGGTNFSISDSDVVLNGDGGLVLDGGNRTTLVPAGHVASNCTLHRNGRWIMNYAPNAFLGGVGNTITRCKVHDGAQIGVFMQGNDHTLSHSEVFDLARQCSDCGAFYGGREWTYRGNRIVHNYFHDIGSIFGGGTQSIYLDDMLSGFDIEGNRFDRGAGDHVLQLGGGRNVRFVGNVLNDSGTVAFDNRGMGWDKGGCRAGGNPYDFLARVPYSDPNGPYAKYPDMINILSDDPCRPKYNELSNNLLCGSAKDIASISAATITSWGSSATNNTYTSVC